MESVAQMHHMFYPRLSSQLGLSHQAFKVHLVLTSMMCEPPLCLQQRVRNMIGMICLKKESFVFWYVLSSCTSSFCRMIGKQLSMQKNFSNTHSLTNFQNNCKHPQIFQSGHLLNCSNFTESRLMQKTNISACLFVQ